MNASIEYSTDGGGTFFAGLPDDGTVSGGLVFAGDVDRFTPATWTIVPAAVLLYPPLRA